MRPKIAVFGGSFNPPGLHHRNVAEELSRRFDRVIVVPCGPRPDQPTTNDVDPVFRAAMADIAFRDLPNVEVDLFDLEQATFTPTDELQKRYEALGDIWHVVGSDLTTGGATRSSVIQRAWERGEAMWSRLQFLVVVRAGFQDSPQDLPPRSECLLMQDTTGGASSIIREHIFRREGYEHLVQEEVAEYIGRYGLYRGRIPSRTARWSFSDPRLLIVTAKHNAQAQAWEKQFEPLRHEADPNCVLVLGGDGTMLHAIRQYWRLRIPFLGVNAGHLGFLLNGASTIVEGPFPPADMVIRQMPLLYISMESPEGQTEEALAFNDAWVERATSQSAWLEVAVNGSTRIPKLVADGALVSTAAGSTAYARSMGAAPLLADTPGWLVVGSNVMDPAGWKSALLPSEACLELRSIGGTKRPLNAFVDGQAYGPVQSLTARLSRIATAELAFVSVQDMAEKIARIQFPAG